MDSLPAGHFTLQQLANIALGGERMTGVNTIVLHSLLDLVLKKLNCQNEKVSISGYEAKQMAELLQTANISPIIFNQENFDAILERFDKLNEMEKRLDETEEKLKEHLLGIRRYLKKLETLEPCRFDEDEYYELCEDFCSTLDSDVKVACETLSPSSIPKKILLRICYPVVQAFFATENKVSVLEDEICLLMERLDETFDSFYVFHSVENEIEWCRLEFDRVHANFIKALNDIQDILDSKINKYQMLQLKDYITEHLDGIYEKLNKTVKEGRCQRACGVIVESAKVEAVTKAKQKQTKKCECEGFHLYAAREHKLLDRMNRIDVKRVQVLLETKGRRSCYAPL